MKARSLRIVLLFLLLLKFTASIALPSPEQYWHDRWKAVLKDDPQVQVLPLKVFTTGFGNNIHITMLQKINVTSFNKAVALAAMLNGTEQHGKITKAFEVDYNGQKIPASAALLKMGDAKSVAQLSQTAFNGNPYFVKAVVAEINNTPVVQLVIRPQIIQFYCNNPGDLYGNCNFAAADLFREMMRLDEKKVAGVFIKASTAEITKLPMFSGK